MEDKYQNTYHIQIVGMIDDQEIDIRMEFANADKGYIVDLLTKNFKNMIPCTLTDIHGRLFLLNPMLIRHCALKVIDLTDL